MRNEKWWVQTDVGRLSIRRIPGSPGEVELKLDATTLGRYRTDVEAAEAAAVGNAPPVRTSHGVPSDVRQWNAGDALRKDPRRA